MVYSFTLQNACESQVLPTVPTTSTNIYGNRQAKGVLNHPPREKIPVHVIRQGEPVPITSCTMMLLLLVLVYHYTVPTVVVYDPDSTISPAGAEKGPQPGNKCRTSAYPPLRRRHYLCGSFRTPIHHNVKNKSDHFCSKNIPL